MPWPLVIQAMRWAAVTAVGYFGYETVKEVSTAVTQVAAPAPPPEPEPHPLYPGATTTPKQARFVRVALMSALGIATLYAVDRVRRSR